MKMIRNEKSFQEFFEVLIVITSCFFHGPSRARLRKNWNFEAIANVLSIWWYASNMIFERFLYIFPILLFLQMERKWRAFKILEKKVRLVWFIPDLKLLHLLKFIKNGQLQVFNLTATHIVIAFTTGSINIKFHFRNHPALSGHWRLLTYSDTFFTYNSFMVMVCLQPFHIVKIIRVSYILFMLGWDWNKNKLDRR